VAGCGAFCGAPLCGAVWAAGQRPAPSACSILCLRMTAPSEFGSPATVARPTPTVVAAPSRIAPCIAVGVRFACAPVTSCLSLCPPALSALSALTQQAVPRRSWGKAFFAAPPLVSLGCGLRCSWWRARRARRGAQTHTGLAS
jgi:hypothetical protein